MKLPNKSLFLVVFCLFLSTLSLGASLELEEFVYSDDAALQKAWVKGYGSPVATTTAGPEGDGAAMFPAPMDTLTSWRVYWDHSKQLDLSPYDRVEVRLRCDHPEAIDGITLMFESVGGWYTIEALAPTTGWSTASIPLKSVWDDGKPESWAKIKRIRMSVKPGQKVAAGIEISSIVFKGGLSLEDMGQTGLFTSTQQLVDTLNTLLSQKTNSEAQWRLDSAENIIAKLESKNDLNDYDSQLEILWGRRLLSEAWTLLQESPSTQEFRGLWAHYGDGINTPGKRSWTEVMPLLKEKGFNALFPNVLWSGVAYYPSQIVPQNAEVKKGKDYLKELVEQGAANGIEIHAWKVMFQFAEGWLSPAGSSDPFKAENRLQVKSSGDTTQWLSPCDPRNIEYEISAMEELVQNYAVKGMHLDYIRFGGTDVDYNTQCKTAFEDWSQTTISDWPKEVWSGEMLQKYNDFRRHLITNLVRETSKRLRAIRSDIQISAAVFPNVTSSRESIFQDWEVWADSGWVDFVAPMNYTTNINQFENTMKLDLATVAGTSAKMYPGLGPFKKMPLATLTDQINLTRKNNTGGYVLFDLSNDLLDNNYSFLAPMQSGSLNEFPDTKSWLETSAEVSVGIENTTTSHISQNFSWQHKENGLQVQGTPGKYNLRIFSIDGRVIHQQYFVIKGKGILLKLNKPQVPVFVRINVAP